MAWRYVGSLYGDLPPFKLKIPTAAGSSATIDDGDLLDLEGGNFAPINSDEAMAATLMVACPETIVTAGDRAGYRLAILPRPGDLFEVDLDASTAATIGAALYYSTSKVATTTAGTNIIGRVVRHAGVPREQGRLDMGNPFDAGTTIGSRSKVTCTIGENASYYNALQPDDVA